MTETTVRGMKGMKSVMDLPVMQVRLLVDSETIVEMWLDARRRSYIRFGKDGKPYSVPGRRGKN